MNCQEVMELMQRHMDKDLNDQETSLMMDHIGRCPECAAMLDRLVHLSKGLEQLPRVEPPFSLVDAILPQLAAHDLEARQEEEKPAAPHGRRAHHPSRAWIARISGVVALGVVVTVFAMNGPFFFSGMGGSSAQKEASILSGSANADESGAYSVKSEALRKDMKSVDQYGNGMPAANAPMSDQAPAAAPSASSQLESNQSFGSGRSSASDIQTPTGAESDGRVKGLTVNPADQADTPPMSMMEATAAAEEAVSPNGEWKAVLTDGTLRIYRTADSAGAAAYELAPATGTLGGLAWRQDNTALDYTYIDADGHARERSILVPEMKEINR